MDDLTMTEYAAMQKRPQYFSFFLEACETLSMLDNEGAGRVIRAIADYFIDGETSEELPEFSKVERRAYMRIKRGIDDSCRIWYSKVVGGKKGAEARWDHEE